MSDVKGFMVFAGDQPMITDMRPHPCWAPQDQPKSFTAKGWSECFSVFDGLEEAQESIKEDIEDMLQAVKDGDLEDYDEDYQPFALPVSINDAGEIVIYDLDGVKETSRHKMEDMYTSFGMVAPDSVAEMTDLDICRDLMKNHEHKGVRQRCMLIELRLVQNQDVDPVVLQEMRDIHAGGDIPGVEKTPEVTDSDVSSGPS